MLPMVGSTRLLLILVQEWTTTTKGLVGWLVGWLVCSIRLWTGLVGWLVLTRQDGWQRFGAGVGVGGG